MTLSDGQRTILKDIQLGVQKGVMTALLGPTGSGETTLPAMQSSWRARDRQPYKTSCGRHAPSAAGSFPAGHIPALPHRC